MLRFLKDIIKKALKAFHLRIIYDFGPYTYDEIDKEFNAIYEHAMQMTQMTSDDFILRRRRHHTLMQALKHVLPDINKADIAECGCFRGLSAYQIAYYAKKNNFNKKFLIFDSFEGLSEFKSEDLKGAAWEKKEGVRKELSCPQNIVEDNLKEFNFVEYKKGWIPSRFSEVSGLKFIFVHIDVDLYQPVKDSLEFFYPRVLSGGIIVFDDYGHLGFPGAKQAVDEFMKDKRDFFISVPSGEAFILKG